MFRFLVFLVLCSGPALLAAAPEVEVATVRFAHVRPPFGGSGNCLEADVVLDVRPPPGARGRMVSRVRVAVLLGFELPATGTSERHVEYYCAEAECVGLEAGRADVRFYLPPELVKRDQLHGEPKYWGVELAVDGRGVAAGRRAYATTLATAAERRDFQTRGAAAAAGNDGILLPQYLTPFANEYPRGTPSFVRRRQ